MRTYKITVNGQVYNVDVEEIGASAPAAAAPVAAPAAAPKAAPAPAAAPVVAGAGESVKAPMPGTILDVKVSVGQSVKNGDVLCILEAMKMENEIMAPCDGVVSGITATKGTAVESGALLCVIG